MIKTCQKAGPGPASKNYLTERKPGKISQAFYLVKFALKSRVCRNFKGPLLCSFKITGRCNLRCAHCPFWRNTQEKQLGFEDVKKSLVELYSDGARIVIFEGGEPLLWEDRPAGKDMYDVIEYSKKLFFFTGVTTNGTLDIERFDPDIFFISIDGLKQTHDRLRGKSFDLIMRNIEKSHLKKKIIANICVSAENSHEINDLVNFLNDKLYGITIQFFYPYENVGDLKLGTKEKNKLLQNLIGLKKKKVKILNSISCLKKMIGNTWKCDDFLVANVEQDGRISQGCYLKNKTKEVSCRDCGFSVHCEISLAYRFDYGAIKNAARIFWG